MEAFDQGSRRRHERVRLGGSARLLVDQDQGASSALGQLVDLSEGGCQLRLPRRVCAYRAARVRLDIGGRQMWFPVLTRWVRPEAGEWSVGCCFDRLTPEKQESVRALLAELNSTVPARS